MTKIVTAYLYRFLNRHSKNPQDNTALLPEEIQNAKRYWLKTMQLDMFLNETVVLKHQCPIPKNCSLSVVNCPYMNKHGLIVFEEDSVELASQERREIPSSYAHTNC